MQLLYVADPLCSWCYGFGPELEKLLARHPAARVELVMGGLRAFNREPASDAFKAMLREHWAQVSHATGLAFDQSVLDRAGFAYDTEPPCRAVVTARRLDPSRAQAMMRAIQAAFYGQGRDVTRSGELAVIARDCGYDPGDFLEAFESQAMRDATLEDFEAAQSLGVGGFPTLGVAHGSQLFLVTSGYVSADVLDSRLAEIDRKRLAAG